MLIQQPLKTVTAKLLSVPKKPAQAYSMIYSLFCRTRFTVTNISYYF
jgi:hypothetical protein